MARLPTLKNGLELKRAAPPAVFTGVMAFVFALVLGVAVLTTMPANTETLSISNWVHGLQEMPKHFQLFEFVRTHWLHLICAILVSMTAGGTAPSAACAAARKRSRSGPVTASNSPGLVQNWPAPMVNDATKPVASASARAASACGSRRTGLMLLISA